MAVHFKDARTGTELRIDTDEKLFQFIAPDKMFSVKYDPDMFVFEHVIVIRYEYDELMLVSVAIDTRLNMCRVYAKDMQTGETYWLVRRPYRHGCGGKDVFPR